MQKTQAAAYLLDPLLRLSDDELYQRSLMIGKNILMIGENSLMIGKNSLTIGKNSLTISEISLMIGKNSLMKSEISPMRGAFWAKRYLVCSFIEFLVQSPALPGCQCPTPPHR